MLLACEFKSGDYKYILPEADNIFREGRALPSQIGNEWRMEFSLR